MRTKKARPSMLKQLTVSDGSSTKVRSNLRISGVGVFFFVLLMIVAIGGAGIMDSNGVSENIVIPYLIILILLASYVLLAIQVASQWEKAVVLRLGKFRGLKGPGLFLIVPI